MTTLTSPHDLLAAIPFLIGYHPQDSLVLVALKDEAVGMAMRVDMPVGVSAEGYDLLASHFLRDGADGAFIVAYVGAGAVDPENVLINTSAALVRAGIDIKESLIVRNNRFRSMICSDLACCPPEGSAIPDLGSSRIAAEHVIAGHPMPFENVDGLVQSIAALPSSFESVWSDEVQAFWVSSDSEEIQELQRDGATAIIDLVGEYREGRGAEDRELAARVIGRLSDIQVRDFALGCHSDVTLPNYVAMWTDLLSMAPAKFVAPVASLCAAITYETGDKEGAAQYLRRAIADDARYSLAALLQRVFASGWPANAFAAMRADLHPKVCALIFI